MPLYLSINMPDSLSEPLKGSQNYGSWSLLMEDLLEAKGLGMHIKGVNSTVSKPSSEWKCDDDRASNLICQNLSPAIQSSMLKDILPTAVSKWNHLKRYTKTGFEAKFEYMSRLIDLKIKDCKDAEEFVTRFELLVRILDDLHEGNPAMTPDVKATLFLKKLGEHSAWQPWVHDKLSQHNHRKNLSGLNFDVLCVEALQLGRIMDRKKS